MYSKINTNLIVKYECKAMYILHTLCVKYCHFKYGSINMVAYSNLCMKYKFKKSYHKWIFIYKGKRRRNSHSAFFHKIANLFELCFTSIFCSWHLSSSLSANVWREGIFCSHLTPPRTNGPFWTEGEGRSIGRSIGKYLLTIR